jgi:PKD repeat protein
VIQGSLARAAFGARSVGALCVGLVVLGLGGGACNRNPAAPDVPPTADFVFNPVSPIVAGQTRVTFNASASHSTDATISKYLWDFGDGSGQQNLGVSPLHVFPVVGTCEIVTYAVQLTVVDSDNLQASANHDVQVTNLPLPNSKACPN